MLNYNLPDFVDLPTFIKKLRKDKGLSQERLGRKVGVTDRAISAYEKGTISPSIDVFFKIIFVCDYALDIKENIYKTPKKLTVPLSQS
jgi:transcriptional regulator with XRE-family HTH domain